MKYWFFLNVWKNLLVKTKCFIVDSFKITNSVFLLVIGLSDFCFLMSHFSSLCVSRNLSVSYKWLINYFRYVLKSMSFLFLIRSAVVLVIFTFFFFFFVVSLIIFSFWFFSIAFLIFISFYFCCNVYYTLFSLLLDLVFFFF